MFAACRLHAITPTRLFQQGLDPRYVDPAEAAGLDKSLEALHVGGVVPVHARMESAVIVAWSFVMAWKEQMETAVKLRCVSACCRALRSIKSNEPAGRPGRAVGLLT
jgi:hypothetical protein